MASSVSFPKDTLENMQLCFGVTDEDAALRSSHTAPDSMLWSTEQSIDDARFSLRALLSPAVASRK